MTPNSVSSEPGAGQLYGLRDTWDLSGYFTVNGMVQAANQTFV